MTQKQKKSINIRKFRKRREINFGVVLFVIVLIYLLVTFFLYLTSKHISIYEVREGSILKDHTYTGLILREEEPVKAEESGYLTYFTSEGNKVKKGTSVYTISDKKLNTEISGQEETFSLSQKEQTEILTNIQNFCDTFQEASFSEAYSLKDTLSSVLLSAGNQTMTAQLDILLAENTDGKITVCPSNRDGIAVFYVDGYEDLTWESLKEDDLVKANLQTVTFHDGDQVTAGDSVYKLITSENWSIVTEIDEDTAKALQDKEMIKTKISKDGQTLWADLEISKRNSIYYAKLTYDNSMIRYATDRFLDVELIMEDAKGLKIPKTAVVEKEYYKVPADYMTLGGNSSSEGVMVQSGDSAKFQDCGTVYYSEEQDYCYLDKSLFKTNTVLVDPDTMETFRLTEADKISGVFNVNKGYAVFKRIDILCESDEYYIISDETTGGLSNYDHIVLNGNTVKENEVVFQ